MRISRRGDRKRWGGIVGHPVVLHAGITLQSNTVHAGGGVNGHGE